MTTTKNTSKTFLFESDLDDLKMEIRYCRQALSWASPTRCQWVTELEAIVDGVGDDGYVDDALIDDARAEAKRLATKVAKRLASDETRLADWIADGCRDASANGDRDGYELRIDGAIAYASCRSWNDDFDYVEVEVDAVLFDGLVAEDGLVVDDGVLAVDMAE